MKLQDDLNALKSSADTCYRKACVDPNPRFDLERSAPRLSKVVKIDYVAPNAKSSVRTSMVERAGMRERIATLKEETGILAYMRRNGLEK